MSEVITDEAVVKKELKSWRRRIFFTGWITYMIYYIGRTNISIAKPYLMSEYEITATVMGFVGTTFS